MSVLTIVVGAVGWFLLFSAISVIRKGEPQQYVDGCEGTETMIADCFKDVSADLKDFLENIKIDTLKAEIITKCNIFNGAMKCFDDIPARCLESNRHKLDRNNVESYRILIDKFCSDDDFQQDYLRHKDCLTYIKVDWTICISNFDNKFNLGLQHVGNNSIDRSIEFCCPLLEYENCIYKTARNNCYKNSTENAIHLSKMLSNEKQFSNCRQFKTKCMLNEHIYYMWRRVFLMGLVLIAYFMCYGNRD